MAQDKGQVEAGVEDVVRKRIDGGDLRRLSPFQGVLLSIALLLVLRRCPALPPARSTRLGVAVADRETGMQRR